MGKTIHALREDLCFSFRKGRNNGVHRIDLNHPFIRDIPAQCGDVGVSRLIGDMKFIAFPRLQREGCNAQVDVSHR